MTSYYKVPVLAIEQTNCPFSQYAPVGAPPRSVPAPPNSLPWSSSDPHRGNFKNLKKYLPVWLLDWHPPWVYHQVLADFLIFAWKFQGNATPSAPPAQYPQAMAIVIAISFFS